MISSRVEQAARHNAVWCETVCRAHQGDGAGGDVTFAVDAWAEASLEEFIGERAPRMAFYSEDRGLVAPPDATDVLVVDPIDGTRPAMAGLESACVAVALAPLGDGQPAMDDIELGCVIEIKSGDWFLAERGGGVRSTRTASLSRTADVEVLEYKPEPLCHFTAGAIRLEPDAFVRVKASTRVYRWWAEIDRSTESDRPDRRRQES